VRVGVKLNGVPSTRVGVGTHVFVPTGEGEAVNVGRGVRVLGMVAVGVTGVEVNVGLAVRVRVAVRVGVIVGGTGEGEEVKVGFTSGVKVAVLVGVVVDGKGDGEGVNVLVLVGDGTTVGGILSKAPDTTHNGGVPLPATMVVPSIN